MCDATFVDNKFLLYKVIQAQAQVSPVMCIFVSEAQVRGR